ncbi:MAG: hypothetical protein K2Y16_03685, partial [Burkholderiales bacterium]|nr:hypothetical protein [Burkholderiales bacterium]
SAASPSSWHAGNRPSFGNVIYYVILDRKAKGPREMSLGGEEDRKFALCPRADFQIRRHATLVCAFWVNRAFIRDSISRPGVG